MKIIAGQLKGRNFYMPAEIPPTQNVVRKAVFDILGDMSGMDFLETRYLKSQKILKNLPHQLPSPNFALPSCQKR